MKETPEYESITETIDSICNFTEDHGEKVRVKDTNLYFVKYGASKYLGIDINHQEKYLCKYYSFDRLYIYNFEGEIFVCMSIYQDKYGNHINNPSDFVDDIGDEHPYYIIHPRSGSYVGVDTLPEIVGGDISGENSVLFASNVDSLIGNKEKCIAAFDKRNEIFFKDMIQLEPASEDEMQEFEESEKIKEYLSISDDDGLFSNFVHKLLGGSGVDEDDVFDALPQKDLREAHNENTLDQHMEKLLTQSQIDKEDAKLILPGFGKSANRSRPNTDLRQEHLDFMESDEYEKILKFSERVMNSTGQTTEDVRKLRRVSNGLKRIESANDFASSDLDIREIQTIDGLIEEIESAKNSNQDSSTQSENITEEELDGFSLTQ